MKNLLTTLSVLISFISFAQTADSTKLKEIEMVEKIAHAFTSELFKTRAYDSKLDKDYKLPWQENFYTEVQLKTALDTLIKNGSINIKPGSFSDHILQFNSYFPEFIKETPFRFLKLIINENNIKDKNAVLDISKDGSTGFGFHMDSGFKDGNSYAHNWKTINKSFNIKSEIETEQYKGSVLFEAGLIKGYDYVKITKSDIGKTMKIGIHAFTVLDVFNNSIVLDFKEDFDDLDFSLINLNDEGHKIISAGMSMISSQTVYSDIYLAFQKNPDLSFDDYKKEFHSKYLKILENPEQLKGNKDHIFGKKLKVLSASDKLINAYLYLPKYHSKVFEITYSDNQKEIIPQAPEMLPSEKKIMLQFEDEDENGVLLGGNINLLDKDLNAIKSIPEGTFIKIVGKSYRYYNGKQEDDSCDGYNYVKVLHNDSDYIVEGSKVFKMEKLDVQPTDKNIELLDVSSRDYLQVFTPIQPENDMEFCDYISLSPIIIRNTNTDAYQLIDVVKDDLYSQRTKEFKSADFFQSGSNSNIYDKISTIEITAKGMVLTIRQDGNYYKVLVTEKNKTYTANYLE